METKDSFVGKANGVRFYRANETENDVVIPPAYVITDERGDTWTIGIKHNSHMEWDVWRNDRSTGEFASRIEYKAGVVTIYGHMGRKRWSGQSFI